MPSSVCIINQPGLRLDFAFSYLYITDKSNYVGFYYVKACVFISYHHIKGLAIEVLISLVSRNFRSAEHHFEGNGNSRNARKQQKVRMSRVLVLVSPSWYLRTRMYIFCTRFLRTVPYFSNDTFNRFCSLLMFYKHLSTA